MRIIFGNWMTPCPTPAVIWQCVSCGEVINKKMQKNSGNILTYNVLHLM